MTFTGLVVIGVQMKLAQQPDGSPFWQFLGPTVFITLVLFVVFYVLALLFRRKRDFHKRLILLASIAALGAAGFRVVGRAIGFGPVAGVGGILLPNLIIVAAILVERRRGEGVHPVYRWGLPASALAEIGVILATPTAAGQILSTSLAWLGAAWRRCTSSNPESAAQRRYGPGWDATTQTNVSAPHAPQTSSRRCCASTIMSSGSADDQRFC